MNNTPLRIAIAGAGGRMASELIKAVAQSPHTTLGAVLCRVNSGWRGKDAGQLAGIGTLNVAISDDIQAIENDFDILIDFTCPEASLVYLNFCCRKRKGLVLGTTGFSKSQQSSISAAANEIGIVFSANFSIGVNLMLKLLEKAAKVIGEEADIEIIEAHHRYKVDAPSGTALAMGEAIAGILDRDFVQCAVYSRQGHVGERQAKSIGFSTVRAGDIVGEHTAIFAELGERLEITHKASSRMTFASGAVRAAVWLARHKTGLFDMVNVLNLDKL